MSELEHTDGIYPDPIIIGLENLTTLELDFVNRLYRVDVEQSGIPKAKRIGSVCVIGVRA